MRVLRGSLAALPGLVLREGVVSPALIIIGEVTAEVVAQGARLAIGAAE
jgi:uroporphyrin-III C-methyltransferase